ncbi:MAG: polyisoprenoid-binding protein [Burkholderiaceae bacterium]|nr:polyisoprenoid-binding protein [Burkholderiaceae bacterium]
MKKLLLLSLATCCAGAVQATPANYTLDPNHTFPSFEADHMGGVSVWRGKINKNAGTVMLDREQGFGVLDVDIDLSSIDFGQDQLNKWAQGKDFFDLAQYPKASYKGKLTSFVNGAPSEVKGELTLHGVTKPLNLKINSFKCIPHPMLKRELCGADAFAVFQRDQYGLTAGKDWGFNMDVTLRIQVEAIKND